MLLKEIIPFIMSNILYSIIYLFFVVCGVYNESMTHGYNEYVPSSYYYLTSSVVNKINEINVPLVVDYDTYMMNDRMSL